MDINNSETTREAVCEMTGRKFQYRPVFLNGREMFKPRYHPETVEQMELLEERERQEMFEKIRRDRFAAKCPPLYMLTDASRLPPQWKQIGQWSPSASGGGLLLIGPTGSGKTRCAWQRIRALVESGTIRTFEFLTEIQFGLNAVDALMNGRWKAFAHPLHRCEILVIDDLGKAKHTERSREALFDVIDTRLHQCRSTIFTTQFSGAELRARYIGNETGKSAEMQGENADALIRRIKEMSTVIVLKQEKET